MAYKVDKVSKVCLVLGTLLEWDLGLKPWAVLVLFIIFKYYLNHIKIEEINMSDQWGNIK